MRINPVLKNESKLSVRTIKFSLMMLFYLGILSFIAVVIYKTNTMNAYYNGINLSTSIYVYVLLAIFQAILLMFIVPSLTATAICSEREKQTLDVLLTTNMSPLSIILGKLISSVSKVLLLIICTLPIYAISFFIGGINFGNLLGLSIFFIVNTFFVGAIGIFISTVVKSSKAATATTYGIVLFLFVGIMIIGVMFMGFFAFKMNSTVTDPKLPMFVYLSPVTGFISLLTQQLGTFGGGMGMFYMPSLPIPFSDYGVYISIVVQIGITVVLVLLSAYKLNPLNNRKHRRVKAKN